MSNVADAASQADAAPPTSLAFVDNKAIDAFLERLRSARVLHELRRHGPVRHARHLAAMWSLALHETARATLLSVDGLPYLAMVPADRKISAPRLRAALTAAELGVLRGDRGVGRIGWEGLPPPPGALPAVPALFGASCVADPLILRPSRLLVALDPGHSLLLAPDDYVRATGARTAEFAGSTRLLPEGGMVNDDPYPHLVREASA